MRGGGEPDGDVLHHDRDAVKTDRRARACGSHPLPAVGPAGVRHITILLAVERIPGWVDPNVSLFEAAGGTVIGTVGGHLLRADIVRVVHVPGIEQGKAIEAADQDVHVTIAAFGALWERRAVTGVIGPNFVGAPLFAGRVGIFGYLAARFRCVEGHEPVGLAASAAEDLCRVCGKVHGGAIGEGDAAARARVLRGVERRLQLGKVQPAAHAQDAAGGIVGGFAGDVDLDHHRVVAGQRFHGVRAAVRQQTDCLDTVVLGTIRGMVGVSSYAAIGEGLVTTLHADVVFRHGMFHVVFMRRGCPGHPDVHAAAAVPPRPGGAEDSVGQGRIVAVFMVVVTAALVIPESVPAVWVVIGTRRCALVRLDRAAGQLGGGGEGRHGRGGRQRLGGSG